jgi:hypothetical protein
MDKPTGDDNFITIDELREHWDVSEKTIRRQIRWRLAADERERFVRKVPLGQSMKGQDGEDHFYYTLERDFWMRRMEKLYPRKRKLHIRKEGTDNSPDTPQDKQRPESGPAQPKGSVSRLEHDKELEIWKELYYHERDERKQERGERQALIQDNMKLSKMLLSAGKEPEESTEESPDSGSQQGADNPPQPENMADPSHESHGQKLP